MDSVLRRAWTEIVTAGDYDRHMAAVGQAQAAAELTTWAVSDVRPGARVVIVGAGTGQMLDYLEPDVLRPFRLTCTDINSGFLQCLGDRLGRAGLSAEALVDDIEETKLAQAPDLLLATLVLEHIDWRRGVAAFASLRPRACAVIVQENPPGMTSSVTPGREVPTSIAKAMESAHPTLVPREELTEEFARSGYRLRGSRSADVADGKRLVAMLFTQSSGGVE
jgi:SAM-dependent methyltransferase